MVEQSLRGHTMSGLAAGPRGIITCMWMLLLSVGCLLGPSRSWADSSSGLAWLAAQSQPDGSYATPSALATPVQASAEALRAFRALGVTVSPGILAARAYLAAQSFQNTEYLARTIITQADAGASVTRASSLPC